MEMSFMFSLAGRAASTSLLPVAGVSRHPYSGQLQCASGMLLQDVQGMQVGDWTHSPWRVDAGR